LDAPLDKKRRAELLHSVFDALEEHPEGIAARDALAAVENTLALTEYEQENYPGTDLRRFEKTVRFQTINAVKAGWMLKEKGVWSTTEAGKEAYATYRDPEQFYDQARALYKAWAKANKRSSGEASVDSVEEDAAQADGSITAEKAEETAAAEIWAYLAAINPYDFQELVAGLLQGMGYHINWVAPPGKDRGIDIVAFRDPLGAETAANQGAGQGARNKRPTPKGCEHLCPSSGPMTSAYLSHSVALRQKQNSRLAPPKPSSSHSSIETGFSTFGLSTTTRFLTSVERSCRLGLCTTWPRNSTDKRLRCRPLVIREVALACQVDDA
jgi:restriction system protein